MVRNFPECLRNSWYGMERRASSLKEEEKHTKEENWQSERCCGEVMAAIPMPIVPQPEGLALRDLSRLGVRLCLLQG